MRWDDNAKRLDVLPVEGVLADGSHSKNQTCGSQLNENTRKVVHLDE